MDFIPIQIYVIPVTLHVALAQDLQRQIAQVVCHLSSSTKENVSKTVV